MGTPDDELKDKIDEINKLLKKLDGISNASERAVQKKEIDDLIEAANEYANTHSIANKNLKDQLKDLNNNQKSLSAILTTNKGIVETFKDMQKESRNFAFSTDKWFKKGEEIAKVYLGVSKNIGLTGKRSVLLTKSFQSSAAEAVRLGIQLSEIDEIYQNFAEETGRARILSNEEADNIAKLAAGTGMYVSEASKLGEQFDLMGLSSAKVFGPNGYINQAMEQSQKMGLNSNKVIKTLGSNMKTMQQYSFKNGVKGMIEMTKQAVKMRMEVSDVLSMSEKFYHPEAAIEAAANLQLLGGDIAKAFGDPFTVMYEARNKPEELAKRVAQMTENMVSFNEETGEFDMPAEARMQLQAVSKELGMSMDNLTDMTRQMSKIKAIKMDVSSKIVDDETRDAIAGLARMKDGKWTVDYVDKEGNKQTKAIDELDKTMADMVLGQQQEFDDKSEKDLLRDIALNTQTFSEKVALQQEARQVGFAGRIGVYEATMEGFLNETITSFDKFQTNLTESLERGIAGEGGIAAYMRKAFGVDDATGENFLTEGFRIAYGNMISSIEESISKGEFNIDSLTSKVTDADIFLGGIFSADDVKFNTGGKTMVTGPAGTFTLNELDEYYGKDGAFVAGTNLGMDKNITKVETNSNNTTMSVGGTATINVNIKSDNPSLDISSMKNEITKVVTKMFNNGGSPDGPNIPQGSKGYIQTMG